MSGVGWDNRLKIIIMGETEHIDYIQAFIIFEIVISFRICNIYLLYDMSMFKIYEPYLNKPIQDYGLLEFICGNDQASGHRVVQYGTQIGTKMDFTIYPKRIPPTKHFDDLSFKEPNAHGDASTLINNQADTSEPTSATSPRRKSEGKRKANTDNDPISKLTTTINDAFESIRSSHLCLLHKGFQKNVRN